MLRSPTVEKLQALRLHGLLAAWEEQETRARTPVALFVAGLGARNSPYVEATSAADLPAGIHPHAFESLGGVPAPLPPDNHQGAVLRPARDAPDLHPTYRDRATHSGTTLLPARGRRPPGGPRGKRPCASSRGGSSPRADTARSSPWPSGTRRSGGRLQRLNSRRFRRLPTPRRALIATLEKPALRPLPPRPDTFAEWKRARVNIEFRSCLGLLRLRKQYPAARLEAACARALTLRALSYKSVQSILRTGLDQQTLLPVPTPPRPAHDHVRGAAYYARKEASDVA